MTSVLIRNANVVASMGELGEMPDCDIHVEGGVIRDVGPNLKVEADEIVQANGCIATPGLINTHHHLFQTLTRVVPAAESALLFDWLKVLYPIWSRLGPDEIRVSAQVGLAELALSGCSLTSDHLYLFPNGARLDDTIEAANTIGMRLLATRGSMSIGESAGGLPPDQLVEDEQAILRDCERLVGAFHNPNPGAMVQIGLAPCSPFSVSRELMRDTALMGRELGVRIHTHLAENGQDVEYSLAQFGCRPGQYAEDLGWTGPDVWHAHCVMLDDSEIGVFAESSTGVAHCPCSNGRLGSGIAPVATMLGFGVRVGLGVDGSASNDSSNLISEARQALLLQRVKYGADALSARTALRLATKGGAEVLGRDDLGEIAPGKRGDIALWDVSGLDSAGAWDPVAALVLAGPTKVRDLFVEGRHLVKEGRLTTIDTAALVHQHTAMAENLANQS